VPKDATDVDCKYCGNPVRIERTRKPPPPELAKPQTVYVKSGLPGFILWIIILTGVLPAFIPIFIFAGPALFKVLSKHNATMPMTCAMNEEVEIENQTFSGSDTLITAELNCKLTIKNSNLTGGIVVQSSGNLQLVVENSTLEGRDVGLMLDNNASVTLRKGSVLKSPQTAVSGTTNVTVTLDGSSLEAGYRGFELGVNGKVNLLHKSKATADNAVVQGETNLEVTLDDSSVDSKDVAIAGNINTKLKLIRGAKVHGTRTAIRTGGNLKLTLDNASVVSEGTAICSGYNADINAAHSIVQGGVEALRFQRKPNELDLRDTSIKGLQIFDAPGCSAGGSASDVPAAPTAEPAIDPSKYFRNLPKGVTRVTIPTPTPAAAPTPVAPPASSPFDADAAARALDAAARSASANCRSSTGKPFQIFVNPGFTPDGANRGAVPSNAALGSTPEAACVLGIFRRVRIPPFDPKTLPGGMGRNVALK
jgi:hypothetical protein